jgi:hypothetical protein
LQGLDKGGNRIKTQKYVPQRDSRNERSELPEYRTADTQHLESLRVSTTSRKSRHADHVAQQWNNCVISQMLTEHPGSRT